MFTGLSVGAARLIVSFGSDELISTYADEYFVGEMGGYNVPDRAASG